MNYVVILIPQCATPLNDLACITLHGSMDTLKRIQLFKWFWMTHSFIFKLNFLHFLHFHTCLEFHREIYAAHLIMWEHWWLKQTGRPKSSIFWDIMLCSLLNINWCFGGTCRLHLQGQRISQARNQCEADSKLCFLVYYLRSVPLHHKNLKRNVQHCSLKCLPLDPSHGLLNVQGGCFRILYISKGIHSWMLGFFGL
jgi:hypothetical protein